MSYPTAADREMARNAYHAFSERSTIRETFDQIRKPVYAALVAATALSATVGVANADVPDNFRTEDFATVDLQSPSTQAFENGPEARTFFDSLRSHESSAPRQSRIATDALQEAVDNAETFEDGGPTRERMTSTEPAETLARDAVDQDLLRRLRLNAADSQDDMPMFGTYVHGYPAETQLVEEAMSEVLADRTQARALAKFADYAQLYGLSTDEAVFQISHLAHSDNIEFRGWEMLGYESPAREQAKEAFEETFRQAYNKMAEYHPGELPSHATNDYQVRRFDRGFKYENIETGKISNPFGGVAIQMNRGGSPMGFYMLDGEHMSPDAYMEAIKNAEETFTDKRDRTFKTTSMDMGSS